ncbi:hypothetical protein F5B20DRAFT_485996 [Whalleya microplaca]|nr:hypothetical protein F5B20DRAFT_485996 [Whalleya microplaca]
MSYSTASSSPPTMAGASAPALAHESHSSLRYANSQHSNPESPAMSFESSFRLEPGFSTHGSESEKHPKGKRKRTTIQDKVILEAAYNSNPKPGKAARLDIVSRVSLNEKEVQIWFQNRRQNDRRKSRPLSPQEIAALRYGGGVQIISSDSLSASMGPTNTSEKPHSAHVEDIATPDVEKLPSTPQDAASQHSTQSSPKPVEQSQLAVDEPAMPETRGTEVATPPSSQKAGSECENLSLSQTSSASVGYVSNRWNLGNSFSTPSTVERSRDDSFRLESLPSSTHSTTNNSPASVLPPPSSSSQVRLSLSLEGKAELISSQSSPPRPIPHQLPADAETLPPVRTHRTLHRSRSALPGITLPPISTLTAHLPPQLTRGRSRDVHAWESCCEADTRDELTKQAENESSGSAIAAISLLRSSSSSASLSNLIHSHSSSNQGHGGAAAAAAAASPAANSDSSIILQPTSAKRNAPPPSKSAPRPASKKPKLARASSSLARLQSSLPALSVASMTTSMDKRTTINSDAVEPAKKKSKKDVGGGHSLFTLLSPSGGGDSDKENWSPDEDDASGLRRRRPLPGVPPAKGPAGAGAVLVSTGASEGTSGITHKDPFSHKNPVTHKNPRRVGRVLGEQDGAARRSLMLENRANTAPAARHHHHHLGGGGGGKKTAAAEAPMMIFEDENDGGSKQQQRGGGRGENRRDGGGEVELFMRGEVSPSKRPDMDCVAGLLSLSQGNWR